MLVRVQVAAVLSVTTVIRDTVRGLCSFLHIHQIFSRVCERTKIAPQILHFWSMARIEL